MLMARGREAGVMAGKPKDVLFHICCGPCAAYPLGALLPGEGLAVVGLWYNPNVHPYQEYRRRLEALRELARRDRLDVVWRDEYPLSSWLAAAVEADASRTASALDGRESGHAPRCLFCYLGRLRAAAEEARRQGAAAFSTTLLVSPYQNHGLVTALGEQVAGESGVPFYYRDLRPHWRDTVERAKSLGLYRQPYCGCVFSEHARYGG
jgi:hypothetical protein